MLDHRRHRDRPAGLDVGGDVAELGEGLLRHGLDPDVEDASARETDGVGVLVADAVPLQCRGPRLDDLLASS